MNDNKLNRRKLTLTAGALAGGAVIGRVNSATAQESTPEASPVASDQCVRTIPVVAVAHGAH